MTCAKRIYGRSHEYLLGWLGFLCSLFHSYNHYVLGSRTVTGQAGRGSLREGFSMSLWFISFALDRNDGERSRGTIGLFYSE